jgi:hypothetical protein
MSDPMRGTAGIGLTAPVRLARTRVLLLCAAALLASGCIEVEQRVKVHDDATLSVKATIKVDPQFEALVVPQMKKDLAKKVPPGVRLDFSQRIDGKAAVVMEADGAAAAAMLKEDGSTTITVSDGGFMKKRYEYREVVTRSLDMPVPIRTMVSLPGSIESVSGGTKTSSDTVEFDQTNAKRGDVFAATSTAFVFSFGGGSANASKVAIPGTASWLMPASVASILLGAALLLTGWAKARKAARLSASSASHAMPTPVVPEPMPVDEQAPVFCSECGARNATGRKFCGQCGQAMG